MKNLLAMTTTFLIALGGFTALPATAYAAEGPEVTVTATVLGEDQLQVDVEATGLPGDIAGAYAAVIEEDATEIDMSGGYNGFARPFPSVTDGETSFSIIADELDRSKSYEVLIWRQHSDVNDDTVYARQGITIAEEQWDELFPPAPVPAVETAVALAVDEANDAEVSADEEAYTSAKPNVATVTMQAVADEVESPAVEVIGATTNLDPRSETLEVTVKGSGFLPHPPATSGANRPPLNGQFAGAYVIFGSFSDNWKPSNGAPANARKSIHQKWAVPEESFNAVGGEARGAVVINPDGTFETTLNLSIVDAEALENGNWGIYTYAGGGATYAPFETYTPVTFGTPASIQVIGDINDLDGAAETIVTVKGSGFIPHAPETDGTRQPLKDKFAGAYVIFGSFADKWKPSANVAAGSRSVVEQKWAVHEESFNTVGGEARGAVVINPDGTFETTLTLTVDEAKELENGNWGIYTYAAGGANYSLFETYTPVTFLTPEQEWEPTIALFEADGTTPLDPGKEMREGDKVIVRGSGFDPQSNIGGMGMPIPNDLPQGVFAVFGSFAQDWKPSAGAASSTRVMKSESRQWAISESTYAGIPSQFLPQIDAQRVVLNEDGSFEAELTLHSPENPLADGNWGIYTYPGGVNTPANPEQELYIPVNFNASPSNEDEDDEVATGGLIWSFKSSWNFYFDNIASGTRTVTDGATLGSNGTVGFVQVAGGDYDEATGFGSIHYQGAVNYVSEMHGFDIVLSDPWITFSASGASLSAAVSKNATAGFAELERIELATLNASTPAEIEGLLTWQDVAGTFVQLQQPDEWIEYSGQAIDLVTFSFGSEAENPVSDPTVTTSVAKVKQGGAIEFVGTNFEAGAAVSATVYSTPVPLGTKNANADGRVAFSWKVPSDFELGQHTVRMVSGDLEASVTFVVEKADAAVKPNEKPKEPEAQCLAREVVGGNMSWGMLGEFRNYVEGKIAKGTFSGGGFNAVGGALNVAENGIGVINFAGSIVATGHNGLLNYELSSPSIQITGPHTAVLYASTSTTDTSGNPSVSGRVAFANVSFGALNISGDTVSVSGASAILTNAGASMFGDFAERYPGGTVLDPVSFSVTLGGEVPCDTSTDPVLLASTGGDADLLGASMGVAVLAMLLGASLLTVRRRRALV